MAEFTKSHHWNPPNRHMPKDKDNEDRPAHEVRFSYIKAAIWKNQPDKRVRFNVTFSRSYKDGDEWKSTDSFGRDDLFTLLSQSLLAQLGHQPGKLLVVLKRAMLWQRDDGEQTIRCSSS